MHGKERSRQQLEELNILLERAKTQQITNRQPVAEYDFIIPSKQYAVFYSEPMPPVSLYTAEIFVGSGGNQVSYFTIVQSYPNLAEVMNNSLAPVPYQLTAGFKLNTDPGVTFVLASTINVTNVGEGVILSIPTGEIDNIGKPVAYSVYMQIQTHL